MQKHIHGGDVYTAHPKTDYSANINPLGVPESVLNAVRSCGQELSNYPDPSCRKLRAALSAKEGIPDANLIFGNGAAELIFALAFALRPRKALLMAPGFAEYEQALLAAGCEISYYELSQEHGFSPGEDYFAQITEELDIVFLCNPNNPTGVCLTPDFLEKAACLCREKGVCLILDECFNGFLDEPESCSLKNRLFEYENLFILKAFTKLYAMPGLRLGYGLCADTDLLEKLQAVLQPWSVSIPAQEAGWAALQEDVYVAEARRMVKQERAFLTEKLESLGLTVFPASANFIFFRGPKGLAAKTLEKGYLIRDCSNYRGLTEGFYRIAVRRPEENREFTQTLAGILAAEGM
ncbi:MAG: threonine-phosphate decarboxylase [Candidatus Limivivens sp.]|nr:threonine-phosphate decarboxylase [Candidatus Limivivens sp.]